MSPETVGWFFEITTEFIVLETTDAKINIFS